MILADVVKASEIWVPIVVAVASAVGGAIGLDIYLQIKNKGKKAKEKRKEEREEEFKSIAVPCIQDAIKPLTDDVAEVKKAVDNIADNELPLLKQANRDSLRNQLFASYRHCAKLGYRSVEDTTNWDAIYDSYVALGGNGFIHELRDKFHAIPLEDLSLMRSVINTRNNNQR